MRIANAIPEWLKPPLRKARRFVLGLKYVGKKRYCPICNRHSKMFGEVGIIPRKDAQCFHCGAVERHRLVWLYFKKKTNLFCGYSLKMLHIAPEEIFDQILRSKLSGNYLTADLHNPGAMVKMDITNIQYPDKSFDVIYCCHVHGACS